MVFKLKHPVSSPECIDESVVLPMGTMDYLKRQLSSVFPSIIWRTDREMAEILSSLGEVKELPVPESSVLVRGNLEHEGSWYEFSFSAPPSENVLSLAVKSSEGNYKSLVEQLCKSTGYVALDRAKQNILSAVPASHRTHRTARRANTCIA
jgi:hypothetical protein